MAGPVGTDRGNWFRRRHLNVPRPLDGASPLIAVVVLSLVWLLIGLASGLGAKSLSGAFLTRDTWLTRPRRFERGGRFYQRRLRIRSWKDLLPEAGRLLGGDHSKAQLGSPDTESLERFVSETRRAEYVHWANVGAGPWFFLVLPPWGGAVMTAFGAVVHLPFVCIQRYNRPRFQRLIDRRSERGDIRS